MRDGVSTFYEASEKCAGGGEFSTPGSTVFFCCAANLEQIKKGVQQGLLN